jgi:hypothetical protein
MTPVLSGGVRLPHVYVGKLARADTLCFIEGRCKSGRLRFDESFPEMAHIVLHKRRYFVFVLHRQEPKWRLPNTAFRRDGSCRDRGSGSSRVVQVADFHVIDPRGSVEEIRDTLECMEVIPHHCKALIWSHAWQQDKNRRSSLHRNHPKGILDYSTLQTLV